ncbi:MAG TPA: hypothetical protein VLA04_02755 [Verrucomicrobiae bacterium]|nr:hypothetical protein [Verrucomicrobiae bacterium]
MNKLPLPEVIAGIIAIISAVLAAGFILLLSIAGSSGTIFALGSLLTGGIFLVSGFLKVVYVAIRNYGKIPS